MFAASPAKTTSAPKFEAPSTSKTSRFDVPSTSISALISTLPVTPSVDPSNVKLPESSSSPEDPAITTLLSVKSLTLADPNVAVSAFKVSISAVPSKCKSLNSLPAAPIFLSSSESGIKLPPIVNPPRVLL